MLDDEAPAPSPRSFVRRALGLATLVAAGLLLFVLVTTGHIEWKLVTLVGFLWAAWSFLGGLAQGGPRHHELMVGIRLAEIYRTRQRDLAKSDALLARLRAKYPDAPELVHAGPG